LAVFKAGEEAIAERWFLDGSSPVKSMSFPVEILGLFNFYNPPAPATEMLFDNSLLPFTAVKGLLTTPG
jgi:hypothetical protein